MRPAPQVNVAHGRGTASGMRFDVMELEESGFSTPARGPDERTPASIPLPDLAPDRRRNMPRGRPRCTLERVRAMILSAFQIATPLVVGDNARL
jgi:hypothetical protein